MKNSETDMTRECNPTNTETLWFVHKQASCLPVVVVTTEQTASAHVHVLLLFLFLLAWTSRIVKQIGRKQIDCERKTMNKMGSAFDNSSLNHKQQEPIILFLSSYRRIEYSKVRQFACKNEKGVTGNRDG